MYFDTVIGVHYKLGRRQWEVPFDDKDVFNFDARLILFAIYIYKRNKGLDVQQDMFPVEKAKQTNILKKL